MEASHAPPQSKNALRSFPPSGLMTLSTPTGAGARGAIISHETGFPMKSGLLELPVGVEIPMPPKMINAAASDGAPPRRIKTVEKIYLPIFMVGA